MVKCGLVQIDGILCLFGLKMEKFEKGYPSPKWQILDSSKLKEFADNNFKFDENGKKSSLNR